MPLYVHSTFHLFIQPRTPHRQCGCFHLLALVNSTAGNMGIQISLLVPAFNSFGYLLKSGIAEARGHFVFKFLRNHLTVFQWLHHLCSRLQYTRVQISSTSVSILVCFVSFFHFFYSKHQMSMQSVLLIIFFKLC